MSKQEGKAEHMLKVEIKDQRFIVYRDGHTEASIHIGYLANSNSFKKIAEAVNSYESLLRERDALKKRVSELENLVHDRVLEDHP